MCDKRSTVNLVLSDVQFRVDPCIREEIRKLRREGVVTLGCCCGHGKYPKTIIIKKKNKIVELLSGVEIKRKKRFYVKDKAGYYYIPELFYVEGRCSKQ